MSHARLNQREEAATMDREATVPSDRVGLTARLTALLIDLLVVALISSVVLWATGEFVMRRPRAATAVLGVVLGFVYFVTLEATQGVTPGKRLLGQRVVRTNGIAIGWGRALLRNVVRPIDYTPIPVIAAISLWSTSGRQRLGDRLAGTTVVRTRPGRRAGETVDVIDLRP